MKLLLSAICAIALSLSVSAGATAQEMMEGDDGHTAIGEAEGAEIWGSLRSEELACGDLSETQFAALGEYFMGQMIGDGHVAMNVIMAQAIGEEAEEEMHVVIGMRWSGCDPSLAVPARGAGFLPMMQMMMGFSLRGGG